MAPPLKYADDRERITQNIIVTDSGCWEWQLALRPTGYGQAKVRGRSIQAHRLSWEAFRGTIPDGLSIDHLCRNRACVNPDHLEPVTTAENIRRGETGGKIRSHCKWGHPLSGDNLKIRVADGRSSKLCRICEKRRWTERNRRNGHMPRKPKEVQ